MKKFLSFVALFFVVALTAVFAVACNNAKDKPNQDATTKHTVTIDNKVLGEEVVMNVRYLVTKDGSPTPADVENGKSYEKGTTLFVQVLNNTADKLIVTAKKGDSTIDSSIISAKSGEEAGAGGLFGIVLDSDVTIELSLAPKTAKITITDGAAAGDIPNVAVNRVHAYNPDDADLADYSDGQEIPIGNKVTVFEWNMATAVHITIVHNGQTVVDKYYAKIEDTDKGHDEFFRFTVEGDVIITTEVAETCYFKIDIKDEVNDKDITFNVRYMGVNESGDPVPVDIVSGEIYVENVNVFVQVLNGTDRAVKVVAKIGGKEIDSAVIGAADGGTPGAGGLFMLPLTGDMTITLSAVSAE